MAVIATRRATTAPILPPMAIPRIISTQPPKPLGADAMSVVRMAMAMPAMPIWLPRRDELGEERPRSARMNRMAATR